MLNFSLPVAHVLIAECEGGVCCVERLFSSSLVAIVGTSFPCKLRICHFKKGTEICSYNYSSPILALRLNRLVYVIYHNTVNQPSVRWRCWLGGRHPACKKTEWWGAGVVICLEQGADLHMAQQMPLSLASVKSRLVLPFWYRLTWVVLDNGPLNGCVCVLISEYKRNLTNVCTLVQSI